ncbi:MAG: hypothetical protein E6R04_09625 [Spirochaetes bacterium]|nr:MAG: hypothetical protein E6R04_09625 [Spirochaetota bacterium]
MLKDDIQIHPFESLNPYGNVVALTANSPDELAEALSKIKDPIKILGFNAYGNRQVCYISAAGMKIKKVKKLKEI